MSEDEKLSRWDGAALDGLTGNLIGLKPESINSKAGNY